MGSLQATGYKQNSTGESLFSAKLVKTQIGSKTLSPEATRAQNFPYNRCLLKPSRSRHYCCSYSPLPSTTYASCCPRYPTIPPLSRKSTTMTWPTTIKAESMESLSPTRICSHSVWRLSSMVPTRGGGELTLQAFVLFQSDDGAKALLSRAKYPLVHKSIRMSRDSEVLLPLWRRPFPRKWVKVGVVW